ncbi:cadherin-like domain-containing protein [Microvirga sp. HBU67558]|uniref:peroxidase family protein n=1 Tax=Microvirga TaxID=186650 RepID=UPI001B376AB1|nr:MULTISPECIES: peroxidase family protein [unclassified Microvirga]MBQ0823847.1 cadherin-like domain-containing protein [Microvirga sp. HBU67558]
MVNLVKHDLEFILKQIKIAERHAAGEDLRDLVAEAGGLDPNAATTPTQAFLLPYGLRTVDGSYNNLVEGRETWGAADQPFPVMAPPQYVNEGDDRMMFGTPANPVWLTNNNYAPGSSTGSPMLPPGTVVDADPRLISNLIADQTLNNPAAISAALTYAGITGAAQLTAIQQIQAARAAITQAQAEAGSAPGAIPGLQAAVGTAEAALAQAQATLGQAQAQATTHQAAHASAVANLAAAQASFNNAKAVYEAMGDTLGIASLNLIAAQQVMNQGQAAADAAQAQVVLSTAALAAAESAVTLATTAKAAAEATLADAQADLIADNAAYATAVNVRDAAQQALDAAQEVLDGLIASGADNLGPAIAEAEADVAAAAQILVDSQTAVDAALAKIEVANAAIDAAETAVANATTALADAEAALAPLQAKADADQALHETALADLESAQEAHDAALAHYNAIIQGGVLPTEMQAFNDANVAYLAAQEDLQLKQDAEVAARTTADASADAADAAQAIVDAANTTLTGANTALTSAQAQLAADESAYQLAVNARDLAQTALQEAQAVLDGLNEQSDAYAQALADVAAAQQILDDSQAAVDAAFAQVGLSTAAVETAEGDVAAATATLANAEAAVTAAQQQLTAHQQAHQAAVAALANAEDALNDAQAVYDFMSAQLVEANADYAAAQQALTASQAAEAEARAAADESVAAVSTAQTGVATATTALTTAEAALADAQGAAQGVTVAQTALSNLLSQLGIQMDGTTVLIPNVSPDIGDSAPYNSLFTLFGQFFDHGLDLIAKGGSGTVYIPLSPDDPLYNPATPHTNFMVLTRAATPDGENTNLTTPWVDQNQTYTSHASHQVFLREYTTGPDGKTVATGKLLDGDRGLATWADVKEQARIMLGIDLTDANVTNVPLLRTDPYGNFIPHPQTGFAQVIVGIGADGVPNTSDDIVVSGTPGSPVSLANAVLTGHAFLDDIAHAAVPVLVGGALQKDGDAGVGYANADGSTTNLVNSRGSNTAYDNELLDAHYITGDGRGNENVGLTTIHHVFHSEHNHLVDQVKSLALSSGDLTFLNEWLLVPVTTVPTTEAGKAALKWDGERLFQAARFTNEMEYQHLVFEEFARKMQPDVDAFVFEPSVDINPAIFAEFAQAVYRFGHSMLNETIDTISVNGQQVSMKLFDGFLNPLAFGATDSSGNVVVDHEQAAGAIIRGMSRQHGNEIDEFITHVLRNQLVGIPLDLAALNIARGRDLGLPTLNEARAQFYQMAGQDSQLKPYVSWTDFALNLQNSLSIVNFIAAYGKHPLIEAATTMEAKRAAATLLVFGGTGEPADRLAFLNGTGAWNAENSGLNDIDLWMGGLAEKKMDFGGMLGSTFAFVFEAQLEALQDADRFYYLSRVQGLNLLNELENNSMTDIIMRNTDLGDEGRTALPGNIFSTPDHTLEIIKSKQIGADPIWDDPVLQALSPLVVRKDLDGDGDDDVLIYHGGDHVVMGGSSEADLIVAGEGDDTVWGYEGNDTIEAGYGVDIIHGGDGDDIITNAGTDIGATDFLHGEGGNDVIQGGSGLALIFGNQGQDFIITGPDGKEAFGGTGNDFILGGDGGDALLGNEGDDWLEGGPRFDSLSGENSELFFNSTIIGHDVLNGGASDTDYDGESGDDIMFQAEGIQRNNGMAGFDWAIHKGDNVAANSDLGIPLFDNQEAFILRDRFDLVEGLSGWKHNDILTGRVAAVNTRAEATGTAAIPGPNSPLESFSNDLLQKNVSLINGLAELVAHRTRIPVVDAQGNPVLDKDGNPELIVLDTSQAADIILGGGGSDTIKGFAGDDIIDGDKWLNVRIRIVKDGVAYTADGMTGKVYLESQYAYGAPVANAAAQFGGKTLDALMLSATLNPGQLSIVREIVDGDLNNTATDVAVYGDLRANYTITSNADGSITVQHVTVTVETDPTTGNNRASDGTDRLFNIEKLRFADGEVSVTPPKLTLHAFDPGGNFADTFNSGSYARNDGSRAWTGNWVETSDDGSATSTNGQIQINNGALRLDQGDGASIQRGLNLAGVASARLTYSVAEQGLDNGEQVEVYFSKDGSTWTLVETITGNTNGGNRGFDITGPFTAGAAIRFVASDINANNEFVNIDNLSVSVMLPAATPTVNHAASFTEGGAAVAIANNPGIVDDAAQMVSARIVLTNAQTGDDLDVGTLPAGISANVDTSVAGRITVNLTGTASLAAYQRAIQAVTFDNNSNNPVAGSRVIQVTVNDGLLDSNVATTTVNVVAVNDPVNANNDTIITNIVNGPIVVPEWVLLSNDTDPDGPALDITGLSNANGLGSLSLTTNPGSVTFTDTGNAGGSFTYTVSDGGSPVRTDTANVTVTRDASPIEGTAGNNILIGDGTASIFDGGTGNDTILAGGGNDTIVWNATSTTIFGVTFETSQDGRDFVDGGDGVDTFDVNGNALSETFRVYSRDAAVAANILDLKATTEIVITRTVNGNTSVMAELDNIEEIIIGTREVTVPGGPVGGNAGGNDTVQIIGNFTGTSLALNTITVNGTGDDDTIDISQLTSAHRIVFRSHGGNDTIVGTLREQDVIELEPGRKADEYEWEEHEDGTTTITSGVHRVTFRCEAGRKPTLAETSVTADPGTPVQPETPANPENPTQPEAPTQPQPPVDPVIPSDPIPASPAQPEAPANLVLKGGSRSETLRGGEGDDRVEGGRGHDRLYGGDGRDKLHGGDGNDRLDGGAGIDRMEGGRGNDVYVVDHGGDRVIERSGQGVDTVRSSVSYSLNGTHVEKLVLTGTADVNGTGNRLDNTLTGNAGDNVLKGGAGHDVLRGMTGDDMLLGGSGRDKLSGGAGNDVLRGGSGDDRLTGGSGQDTFVFERGGGRDVVTDFRADHDRIDASRLSGVDKLSDLHLTQVGHDTVIDHGSDILVLKGVTASDLDNSDFIF